jgi:hypothetical protein
VLGLFELFHGNAKGKTGFRVQSTQGHKIVHSSNAIQVREPKPGCDMFGFFLPEDGWFLVSLERHPPEKSNLFLKWAGGTRFAVSDGVVLGAGVIEERGSIGPENRCERRGLSWQPKEEGTQSSRPGFFS